MHDAEGQAAAADFDPDDLSGVVICPIPGQQITEADLQAIREFRRWLRNHPMIRDSQQ